MAQLFDVLVNGVPVGTAYLCTMCRTPIGADRTAHAHKIGKPSLYCSKRCGKRAAQRRFRAARADRTAEMRERKGLPPTAQTARREREAQA